MPTAEVSVDRDPLGAGKEFTVAIRTTPVAAAPARRTTDHAAYTLVLDASQSMGWAAEPDGDMTRWALALLTVDALLQSLPDRDEVSVIAFDSTARVLTPSTTVAHLRSDNKVGRMPAPEYGLTNIEAGLTAAYTILHQSAAPSRRAILISDGEPTDGATSPVELTRLARRAADRDVYTDAIGMGAGADADLLLALCERGNFDHIETAAGTRIKLQEIVGRLSKQGQHIEATGGELRIDIHPAFTLHGVYALHPARRRLEVTTSTASDGATRIQFPIGAVGVGDQQPLYVLRLSAPDKLVTRSVEVLRVSGSLRTPSGPVDLAQTGAMVSGIAERSVITLEQLMPNVRSIDLEAKVARTLRDAPTTQHEAIYREAKDQALNDGLDDLARIYQDAVKDLHAGLDANDVRGGGRARSSTSRTTANALLQGRPTLDPEIARRQGGTQRVLKRTREQPAGQPWSTARLADSPTEDS
ncbi:vWA domain-containing protein [Nocardia niigatensis]